MLLVLPSLIPKQEVHSVKDTCLSLSASHSWKKREVQCSMGTRGTLSGASSEWDRNLHERDINECVSVEGDFKGGNHPFSILNYVINTP